MSSWEACERVTVSRSLLTGSQVLSFLQSVSLDSPQLKSHRPCSGSACAAVRSSSPFLGGHSSAPQALHQPAFVGCRYRSGRTLLGQTSAVSFFLPFRRPAEYSPLLIADQEFGLVSWEEKE